LGREFGAGWGRRMPLTPLPLPPLASNNTGGTPPPPPPPQPTPSTLGEEGKQGPRGPWNGSAVGCKGSRVTRQRTKGRVVGAQVAKQRIDACSAMDIVGGVCGEHREWTTHLHKA
jgi:hypothetical protein